MGFLIVILIVVMFVLAIGSVVSHKKRIGRIATRNKQARLLKKKGAVLKVFYRPFRHNGFLIIYEVRP